MKQTAAQRLLPYFAAAGFLAGAGCAPRLQDISSPFRTAADDSRAEQTARNDDIRLAASDEAAQVLAGTQKTETPEQSPHIDWRDHFRLNGLMTPEVAETLDKIFSIPEARDALAARTGKYRAIKAYLDDNMGSFLPVSDDLARVRDTATVSPLINIVTSDALGQVTSFDSRPTFIENSLRDIWLDTEITVGLKQSEQYLTKQGGFHDFTFAAALTHEIAHVVLEMRDEDETTEKTNEWLGVVAPELPERGDYYFRRLQPDAPDCKGFDDSQIGIKAVKFKISFNDAKKDDPNMRMPDLRDAKGKPLKGDAIYTRLSEIYFSGCPGYKRAQPKFP